MKAIRLLLVAGILLTFITRAAPVLASTEVFTVDYIETDPNNHWAVYASNVTASGSLSNESDHMQKDFGVDHFNGLNIQGAGIIYPASDNGIAVGPALTANVTTDYSGFGAEDVAIVWRGDLGRAYFTRGVAADYDYLTITNNTWYYWWITRTASSANVTCRFYSDDTFTTLLKTITLTSFSTSDKWRYLYAFASYNGQGGATSYWNGAFKNYDLNEVNSPSVSTEPATNATNITATLNGSLNALNGATSANVSFQYGEDTSYGTNTTAENVSSLGAFSANISGLTPLTTYHFRAVGVSDGGTGYGIDRTFLTSTSNTTVGALTLVPGLANIAVYSAFSDDNGGNNSATVQYKTTAGVTWKTAPSATVDRRATISDDTGSLTNYFANQYRTVIFGLSENTSYDVRVTYTDPDGFTGADNVTGSVLTRTVNPSATGNTYYVTKAGNDSTGDGSVGNPWLTIQKGVNSSVAGDTIKVGAGTYGEQVSANVSGTAANYIIIEAVDPANKPNIDGGGVRNYGIVVTGDYIKFKNLSVDNITGDEGIDIDVQQKNGIIFDGIEINGPSGGSQNSSGIRLYGSSSNCTIVNSSFTHAAHLGDESAVFVKATDAQLRAQPSSITDRGGHVIASNVFTGYWHDTVSAYGNQSLYGGMPRSTFIYSNNVTSTGATDSDDIFEVDGENTNVAIFNNNLNGSSGYKADLSIAGSYIGPNFVVGNILNGVVHDGYPVKLAAGANQTGYVYFYHNTAYDPGDDGGGLVDAGGGGTNSNWYSYNNIYDSVNTYAVALMRAMDASTGAFNYDIMIREGAGNELKWTGTAYTWAGFRAAFPALEVNGQNVDPKFVTPGSDFTLQASSPAVDNGTAIVGINDAGSLWAYSGTAPDIGALELFIPTEAPAAPTNVAASDGTFTDKVVVTWTKSVGATDYHVWRDAADLGSAGDVSSFNDTGAAAPTITPGVAVASDGTFAAYVTLILAGASTTDGTTYTYKVVASNEIGNSPDSGTDQGHRGVGSLTYQWQMSAADSDAGYSNIVGATTASYNATGAPSDGSGRYFRTILNATGASQATSVADRGYRIAAPATPTPPSTSSSATTLASTLFPLAMIIFPIVYFAQMSSKSQGISPVVAVGLMAVIAIGAMALLAALMAAF